DHLVTTAICQSGRFTDTEGLIWAAFVLRERQRGDKGGFSFFRPHSLAGAAAAALSLEAEVVHGIRDETGEFDPVSADWFVDPSTAQCSWRHRKDLRAAAFGAFPVPIFQRVGGVRPEMRIDFRAQDG